MNKPLTVKEIDDIMEIERTESFQAVKGKLKLKVLDSRRIADDMLVIRYEASYKHDGEKVKARGRFCVYKQRLKTGKPGMKYARVVTMQWTENTGTDEKQRARQR